jgi:hypothetical protein
MRNLAAIITKNSVTKALDKIIKTKMELTSSTKYYLIYKNQPFPPKEVARIAAQEMGLKPEKYNLTGGDSTNNYFKKMGFEIVKFRDWENSSPKKTGSKEKIARIVWNVNGWKKPSGRNGKSKSSDSHEFKHGYGHEEWLLDFSKIIDDYHYAFMEPIHKNRNAYIGKTFDITLYTINGVTKERFLIGVIKNVECIDEKESLFALGIYRSNKWLNEMIENLEDYGLNTRKFRTWFDETLFNIKFKESHYEPFPVPILIDKNDPLFNNSRYILLNKRERKSTTLYDGEFIMGSSSVEGNTKESIMRVFQEKAVEISQIHDEISIGLARILKSKYKEVVREQRTGFGTRIDIAIEDSKFRFFYEIKTFDHILICIRAALGQLMEYSYYPSKSLADRLYIVSHHFANDNIIAYLNHLKIITKLPLHYICFDHNTGKIIQEI